MVEKFGLYLHVPFCRRRCRYCDFYSLTDFPDEKTFLSALMREVGLLRVYLQETFGLERIEVLSFYAGGGTPSLLSPSFYEGLFTVLSQVFVFSPEELTIEANPESLDLKRLVGYRQVGFNRLSLGVQSLSSRGLRFLGRPHGLKEALRALELGAQTFVNLSVDLIFGWFGQGEKLLLRELETLQTFPVTHLSLYELTPYLETPFTKIWGEKQQKKNSGPGRKLYLLAHEFLTTASFDHYEISNYAKRGYEGKHNLLYWEFKPYLGLGPSSVSRVENLRFENPRDLSLYLKSLLREGKLPHTVTERFNQLEMAKEIIFMGLRIKRGISQDKLVEVLGFELPKEALEPLRQAGLIELREERVSPTVEGFLRHSLVVKYLWRILDRMMGN